MPDDLRTVPIERVWNEGERLRALVLAPSGGDLETAHRRPGQYVQARAAGSAKAGFFALANPPGRDRLELLVQRSEVVPADPSAADRIFALGPGELVEVGPPAGAGFPLDDQTGRDLILCAGGSGISAIRSLVEHVIERRSEFGRVTLLFGARRRDDLAYRDRFDDWRAGGITVEPSLSRPDGGTWTGRVGYVVATLADLPPDAARTTAFVAGGKAFLAAVESALLAAGLPRDRILRNF